MIDLTMQQYVDWRVKPVMKIRNVYGYRVVLRYADGSEKTQQKSGFPTKREASFAGDIQRLYNEKVEYSVSVARLVKCVINLSFRYALNHKFIAANPAVGINLPKIIKEKPYHVRNIDTKKTLTKELLEIMPEVEEYLPGDTIDDTNDA